MNTLAIVIPYYKIDFFEETLKSVANQRNQNFTLYIGNDASPDDPLPLIKKHADHLSYFYYNYEDNLGGKNLALQWERILENVEEEWFQILGDDDLISDNFVESFYTNISEAENLKTNVIKFRQHWIDTENRKIRTSTSYPKTMSPWENWCKKNINGDPSSLSEYVFRMKSYKKIGFLHLPLAWGSDDIAVLEFAADKPILFIDSTEVKIRISTANISGKTDNQHIKSDAEMQTDYYLITKYYKKLPKKYLLEAIDRIVKSSFVKKERSVNLNLFKIYLERGELLRLLKLPILYYYLYRQT